MHYSTTYSFQSVANLQEEQFYKLFVYVYKSGLSYALVNKNTLSVDKLEEFQLAEASSETMLIQHLSQLCADIEVLRSKLWHEIIVYFHTENFTFIPLSLYDEEQKNEYFGTNFTINFEKELILSSVIKSNQIVTLFTISNHLSSFFNELFAGRSITFIPYINSLVENFAFQKQANEVNFYMYLVDNQLSVVVINKEKHLLYGNQFFVQSNNDILYYILLVAEELAIDNEQLELSLYGYFTSPLALINLLKTYIGKVSWGVPNYNFKIEHFPAEIPNYRHIVLYNSSI